MNRLLTPLHRPRILFGLLLAAYCVYAGAFIFTTSALVRQNDYVPETQRYFVLFDDMMISMRYAKNLVNGDGLVWNPGGERVEGYTNPGWVLYMALFHALGIAPPTISLAIQLSGAGFMLLTLWGVWRIAHLIGGERAGPRAALIAALFTAFYLPLNVWSLQGTEVSALMSIATLATWGALRALAQDRFAAWPYLLLGFSTVIRIDMAVPLLMLGGFLFVNDRAHRWQHAGVAALCLVGFAAPQFAFRRWYYGEWLPNTYYLKVQGYPFLLRILRGLEVTLRLLVRLGPLPFGVFVFRRDRAVRLLLWLFVGQMLYSIYVGGDAWEEAGGANRYQSIAMPLLFVLLALTLVLGADWLRRAGAALQTQGAPGITPGAVRAGLLATVGALLVTVNYTATTDSLNQWLLLKPPLLTDDTGDRVRMALLLDALTTEDATVAVAGAGIVPYFTDRPYVDLLGKNDAVIAHRPADTTIIPEFKPGHMKWDYAYSIGALQPDVVLELWVAPGTAAPYLEADYHAIWFPPRQDNVWMRKESPQVRWARIWGE